LALNLYCAPTPCGAIAITMATNAAKAIFTMYETFGRIITAKLAKVTNSTNAKCKNFAKNFIFLY
ncbi:MAG: hypothetical protein K6F33_04100, partial [Bacteroidales bacterium]|nr:hypothetical protein [Bacteroidales bacterium]